jgi:hypothetical protein
MAASVAVHVDVKEIKLPRSLGLLISQFVSQLSTVSE